jgi:hypothetical protein
LQYASKIILHFCSDSFRPQYPRVRHSLYCLTSERISLVSTNIFSVFWCKEWKILKKKHINIIVVFLWIFILNPTFLYGYGTEQKGTAIIVRTINVHHSAADYPLRIRGIAEKFYHDYPHQIGLIGIQELKRRKMTDCIAGGSYDNGARCLAAELARLYGQKAGARISGRYWLQQNAGGLGVIADDNWRIMGQKTWSLGYDRFLMEVFLEHRTEGYRLRFYNTHLSIYGRVKWYEKLLYGYESGKDKGQKRRSRQVSKIIEIVKDRAKPGELPPIIAGDFNAGQDFVTGETEVSVRKMEEHFHRQIDSFRDYCSDYTVTDHIYIGRKETFTLSRGSFQLLEWHRIYMDKKPVFVDGKRIDELTDHNAEGFIFNIVIKPDKDVQRGSQ